MNATNHALDGLLHDAHKCAKSKAKVRSEKSDVGGGWVGAFTAQRPKGSEGRGPGRCRALRSFTGRRQPQPAVSKLVIR
jgi:hypothetical protein